MARRVTNSSSGKSAESNDLEYSSVQKALGILLSFIPSNTAAGNLELSRSLGLNKSTVSRLTRVLAHYGLLQQDEKTQKYELGRMSAMLGMAVEASQNERLAQLGQPHVEELRNAVRESVCLEVLLPTGHIRLVCTAVGPQPLTITFPEELLMQVSAGAKAILAFADSEIRDSMITAGFGQIADQDAFQARLAEVKKRGFAYDRAESNAGVHTISVPVFNHLQKPVAALSICVPSDRAEKISDPENIALLKKTAMSISSRLFYEAPKK
jgi:DNA-binding IclR family transcriptional regulator